MVRFPNGVKEGGERKVTKAAKEKFEQLTNIPLTEEIAKKVFEQERIRLEAELNGKMLHIKIYWVGLMMKANTDLKTRKY